MTTIRVIMDQWGPDYLLASTFEWDDERAPSGGKMCCLGFACEQLGVDRDSLVEITMPDGIDDLVRAENPELQKFIQAIAVIPHESIRKQAYRALDSIYKAEDSRFKANDAWTVLGAADTSYMHLLAKVNDSYHNLDANARPKVLEEVKEVLISMFGACGYALEFVP